MLALSKYKLSLKVGYLKRLLSEKSYKNEKNFGIK